MWSVSSGLWIVTSRYQGRPKLKKNSCTWSFQLPLGNLTSKIWKSKLSILYKSFVNMDYSWLFAMFACDIIPCAIVPRLTWSLWVCPWGIPNDWSLDHNLQIPGLNPGYIYIYIYYCPITMVNTNTGYENWMKDKKQLETSFYIFFFGLESVALFPWNKSLKTTPFDYRGAQRVGLTTPSGAGGMRIYHPDYLRKLRRLCDELDVLLIFDETLGRPGESETSMGWFLRKCYKNHGKP